MSQLRYRVSIPLCAGWSGGTVEYPRTVANRQNAVEDTAVRGLGQIEYRLARDSAVRNFRRGRLSKHDVCDAQTELLRIAKNLGQPTETACPICEDALLVNVSFAFGPRLPPGGRVVASQNELRTLARASDDVTFYVVEVCTTCGWNHLLRNFSAQAARRRPSVRGR
jgi:hypothetical protein